MRFILLILATMRVTVGVGERRLVINGVKVEDYVPWQVYGGDCGGAIIAKDLVVTAAHCADSYNPGQDIYAGIKSNLDPGPHMQKRKILHFVRHPMYTKGTVVQNDVAILRVSPPFDFEDPTIVAPAILPFQRPEAGEAVSMSGFGFNVPAGRTQEAYVLRATTGKITIVNRVDLVILGDADTDMCKGDSGSAATVLKCGRAVAVGVVSNGGIDHHCSTSTPTHFTNLHTYLEWMQDVGKKIAPDSVFPSSVEGAGNCDAGEPSATTPATGTPPTTTPATGTPPTTTPATGTPPTATPSAVTTPTGTMPPGAVFIYPALPIAAVALVAVVTAIGCYLHKRQEAATTSAAQKQKRARTRLRRRARPNARHIASRKKKVRAHQRC